MLERHEQELETAKKDLLGRIAKNHNKVDVDKEAKPFTQIQDRKKSSEIIE
jgi:hypothetical protein